MVRPFASIVTLFFSVILVFTTPSQGMSTTLEQEIPELNLDEAAFEDALDFLRDLSGRSIVVDWNSLKDANVDPKTAVTLQVKRVRTLEALDKILKAVPSKERLGFHVQGRVVVVSTLSALGWEEKKYKIPDSYKNADGEFRGQRVVLLKNLLSAAAELAAYENDKDLRCTIEESDGHLIVTTSPEGHRRIAEVLEKMKKSDASRDD